MTQLSFTGMFSKLTTQGGSAWSLKTQASVSDRPGFKYLFLPLSSSVTKPLEISPSASVEYGFYHPSYRESC